METDLPRTHVHVDCLDHPLPSYITDPLGPTDINQFPVTSNLSRRNLVLSLVPDLKREVASFQHLHLPKLPRYDPGFDLHVVIRLVEDNDLNSRVPEVQGVHGQYFHSRADGQYIVLLCGTDDLKRLRVTFTHELGHSFVRVSHNDTNFPGGLADWLLSEVRSECLVRETHGQAFLSHARPSLLHERLRLKKVLEQEHDAAEDQHFDQVDLLTESREFGLASYAFVYKLVTEGPWSFETLKQVGDRTFRQELLSNGHWWTDEPTSAERA